MRRDTSSSNISVFAISGLNFASASAKLIALPRESVARGECWLIWSFWVAGVNGLVATARGSDMGDDSAVFELVDRKGDGKLWSVALRVSKCGVFVCVKALDATWEELFSGYMLPYNVSKSVMDGKYINTYESSVWSWCSSSAPLLLLVEMISSITTISSCFVRLHNKGFYLITRVLIDLTRRTWLFLHE